MSGGTCHYCANRDCTCTPPARDCDCDWKPVTGEKVLVEAEATGNSVDVVYEVAIKGGIKLFVPLSSIHQMTRKEGE